MAPETNLHANVAPFAHLIGTWCGEGRGVYPTISDFTFTETLTFSALPGKPFLRYEQRTIAPSGAPMHTELGFLRPVGGGALEFTLAQPTGQTELLEGTADEDGRTLNFDRSTVVNTPSAKAVREIRRRYALDEGLMRLHTEFDMATQTEDMTNHLVSDLTKVDRGVVVPVPWAG